DQPGSRTDPQPLSQPASRHHVERGLPGPRVHREGHSHSVLRRTSRQPNPLTESLFRENIMKIRRLICRSGIIAAFLPLLNTLPGHAQVAVFDATEAANAVKEIRQFYADYQQAVTTYSMLNGNLKNFSSKQIWRTIESQLAMASIANNYGETTGLQGVMNGQSPGTASTVWKFINLGLNSTSSGFLSQQVLGKSQALSTLARMEAMDGVSTQCLQSVGNYNQQRGNNLQPQAALTQSQFDTSSFTTTELEQLNLINMHNAHGLNEAQSQGALHACQAAQAAVANMAQRAAAATEINNAAAIQQQRTGNPSAPANS